MQMHIISWTHGMFMLSFTCIMGKCTKRRGDVARNLSPFDSASK